MKAFVVLMFCAALCNGAYLDYEEDFQDNSTDGGSDMKSILETCTEKGSKSFSCNYSTFLSSVTKTQQDFCEMAFELACSEAQESAQCSVGQKAAKFNEKCSTLSSDVSKNCCLACKIGRHIKRETGKCADNFSALSPTSRSVAAKCCSDDSETDFYANYDFETKAIDIRPDNDYLAPEAITAGRCSDFNPCSAKQVCVDFRSGSKCECKVGYEETEIGVCRDIDECSSGTHNCTLLNRQCGNLEGSFKCRKCLHGFRSQRAFYSDDGDDACVDIDECKKGACKESEKCTNLIGSHRCTKVECPAKYKKSGEHECVWKNCDLSKSRICHKTYAFVTKTVSPLDHTNEILKFYATGYAGTFDTDLFEVVQERRNAFVLKQKKPLHHDEKFLLTIRHGRKEFVKDVTVFRSDY